MDELKVADRLTAEAVVEPRVKKYTVTQKLTRFVIR